VQGPGFNPQHHKTKQHNNNKNMSKKCSITQLILERNVFEKYFLLKIIWNLLFRKGRLHHKKLHEKNEIRKGKCLSLAIPVDLRTWNLTFISL
jgi:hypothetical protein